jgi:hypothetical protein
MATLAADLGVLRTSGDRILVRHILPIVVMLFASSCGASRQVPPHCILDGRLTGKWMTGIRQTQMGRAYDEVEYRCDCSTRGQMVLIDAKMTVKDKGTFNAKDGGLAESVNGQTTNYRYSFDDDMLVVVEDPDTGTDTFRFRRLSSLKCRD